MKKLKFELKKEEILKLKYPKEDMWDRQPITNEINLDINHTFEVRGEDKFKLIKRIVIDLI